MLRRSHLLAATALGLAVVAVPAVARASWLASGTGTATGSARALAAASSVSAATVTPTTSAIDVTFAPGSNPSGTTYTVTRDKTAAGAAGVTTVCSGLTASPCHDTGLAGGTTFTYTVKTVLQNWSANSATAAATTASSAPTVSSPMPASPASVSKGTTANVTVTGTGFATGITVARVAVDSAFTINSITFVSSTQVTLNVTAANANNKVDGFKLTNADGGTVTCASCLKST